MRWLEGFKRPPKRTHIVHGEPSAQHVLRDLIIEKLGWDVVINKKGEEYPL
jgi:metallo-beta-lactamase family protein